MDHKRQNHTSKISEKNQPISKPAIILVNPQMAENIGATARAMMNCGLEELRLVAPRDGWPNAKAYAMASGADEVLDQAKLFTSMEEAVQDCHILYAATARRRELNKPVTTPRAMSKNWIIEAKRGKKQAFLFGAERQGLENEQLVKVDYIIEVPLNPDFKSLNLSQAVLLCAYEWYQALLMGAEDGNGNKASLHEMPRLEVPATHQMFENLFEHLNLELEDRGFYVVEEKKKLMQYKLRSILQRAFLSKTEVQIFHGLISALAGRRKNEILKDKNLEE